MSLRTNRPFRLPSRLWKACGPEARAWSATPLFVAWALIAFAGTPASGFAQANATDIDLRAVTSALEREIHREMLEGAIPSMTVALVSEGEVLWTAGFGDANLRSRVPATPSTVYLIASTFKTMSTAALLQLYEDELFDLDDPVRDYMADGMRIRRERRSDPVTFRHLLTHTSGMPTVFSSVPVWADTVPAPMNRYLRDNLSVEGPPLDRVRYSNMAFTLVAHLVEEISGVKFQDYVRHNVLFPMGMLNTAFVPSPAMEERMAVPYVPERGSGRLAPTSRIRFAEWPAGQVWGTVEDQARWLAANLNGGVLEGRQVLSPAMVELSQTVQFEQFTGSMAGGWGDGKGGYGLAWWISERDGERYVAHSGSVRGYTAFLHGNLDRGFGIAILTNGHRAHSHLVRLSYLATDLMARYSN